MKLIDDSDERQDKDADKLAIDTFYDMEYPFKECARPVLLKMGNCLRCSLRQFCGALKKET